jgi:hypothetical protein
MDVGQAKTRFFKRNSEKADQLTIHPHKEDEFWLWVNSWAAFIQRPSDLGFSDEGYDLPPIEVRWHEVPSDHKKAGEDAFGQGRLLKADAIGIVDASREKRESLGVRIEKMKASCWPKMMAIACCGTTSRTNGGRSRRRYRARSRSTDRSRSTSASGDHPLQRRRDPLPRGQAGAGRVGLQLPAALRAGDLPRHRVQVQRLHPGDPPHPAIPADEAGRGST